MLSEALHTVADMATRRCSTWGSGAASSSPTIRSPTAMGPSATSSRCSRVGIFVLGCGVTVYHGIHNLLDPPELRFPWWTFAVLGFSVDAGRDRLRQGDPAPVLAADGRPGAFGSCVRSITDLIALAVVFEDFAACLGVVCARRHGPRGWTKNRSGTRSPRS